MDLQLALLSKLGVGVSSLNVIVGLNRLGDDLAVYKVVHALEVLFTGRDDGAEGRVSIEAKVVGTCAVSGQIPVSALQNEGLLWTLATSHYDNGGFGSIWDVSWH